MKAGWREANLSDVCEFRRGLTYSKRDEVERSTQAVLRATNISLESGALDLSEIRYVSDSLSIPSGKKVLPGTLVVCTASGSKQHLGKAALIENEMDFAFGGFMGLIVPDGRLIPKFLFWLMRSDQYWTFIDGLADGANINNLKFSQLGEFRFYLPPLEEQRRIVAVLDEAFEGLARARENAEANLQNARELFASVLEAAFLQLDSSRRIRLASLCGEGVITYGVIKLGDDTPDGVPCLRTSNVRPLLIDTSVVKRIKTSLSGEYSRTILRGGEVLVNVRGTLGGVAVVPAYMAGWNVSREVAVVPANADKIEPQFLAYYIATRASQNWLTGVLKGAAYTGINIEDLRELPVPVVDIPRQREVVKRLDLARSQFLRAQHLISAKLEDLENLRQSLLQKAFAGELT